MRWNWRERLIGGGVAAWALLFAVGTNFPATMLVQRGMTQEEVKEALWVGGKTDSFHDWFPSPSHTEEQKNQSMRDFYRSVSFRYKYDSIWGTVVVSFRHTDDGRRADYIEVVSTSTLVYVLDVILSVALGVAAAEIARSVRPPQVPAPAA